MERAAESRFDIVLTADRSVMNDFHLKGRIAVPFYGSGEMFPRWLFGLLVHDVGHQAGVARFAPYPLRKVEAILQDAGFHVAVVSPQELHRFLPSAKILGVHTVDPLGFASKPFLFEAMSGYQHYSASFFQQLLGQPEVHEARMRGLKVIVGGQGAWQLTKTNHPLTQEIDSVIVGEAEQTVPQLCRDILAGRPVPQVVHSLPKTLSDKDFSVITNPSGSGCIAVGRGCNRHCAFCEVTKSNLCWYPLDVIGRELQVNRDAGLSSGMLHAEDILLYGVQGFVPDVEKVTGLFEHVYRYYDEFVLTHFSFAAVKADPSLVPRMMELVRQHQDFMMGEAGIETGSARLMKQTMSGKALPFSVDDWQVIVHESLGRLHDEGFIPFCSLIVGLPGETDEDVRETLTLVDDIKDIRCILLPSGFTPLGTLSDNAVQQYRISALDPLRRELVETCLFHNTTWVPSIGKIILNKQPFYRFLASIWYTWSYARGMAAYYHAPDDQKQKPPS